MNSKRKRQYLKRFCKRLKTPLFILFFLVSHVAFAQTDFLGISSIALDGQVYNLKWSANAEYRTRIIEEYLLPGESITRYKTKLIVEYIRSGKTMEEIAESKLTELESKKEEGQVLNYQQLESENPNEIVIEFLIGDVYEKVAYNIEWNVYRYKFNAGGVILFAMSRRAYEEENVAPFMQEVRENRLNWINAIVSYHLPEISVGKK
jgi:hypothetical protein